MTFDAMMMLGHYPFMLNTAAYTGLRPTASWRWARQDRIGDRIGDRIETHPLLPSGQVLFTPTPRSRHGQHQA